MANREYLDEIKAMVGNDLYAEWEQEATLAYDTLMKLSKQTRRQGDHHDPHLPRNTIKQMIMVRYDLWKAGYSDIVIEIKPRASGRTSSRNGDLESATSA